MDEFLPGDLVEVIFIRDDDPPQLHARPGRGEVITLLRPGDTAFILGREPGSPRNWWYVTARGVMGWLCDAWIGRVISDRVPGPGSSERQGPSGI